MTTKVQVLTVGSGQDYERLLKKDVAYYARLNTGDIRKSFVMVHHNLNPKFYKVSWLTNVKDKRYETVLIPVQACKEFVVLPRARGRGKAAN